MTVLGITAPERGVVVMRILGEKPSPMPGDPPHLRYSGMNCLNDIEPGECVGNMVRWNVGNKVWWNGLVSLGEYGKMNGAGFVCGERAKKNPPACG